MNLPILLEYYDQMAQTKKLICEQQRVIWQGWEIWLPFLSLETTHCLFFFKKKKKLRITTLSLSSIYISKFTQTVRGSKIWLAINVHSVIGSPSYGIELILLKISLICMPLTKMRLPERTILNLNECCLRWNNLLLILTFVINRELFGCIWFFTFFS